MDSFSQFRTLEDLVNCLSKERKLLRDVFGDRKTHVYSMDLAMELVEHRRERIQYLIEQQNQLFKKIRKLKYLRDQLTIKESTNIRQVLSDVTPLWMENRQYNKLRLSIEMLQSSDEMAALIRKIGKWQGIKSKSRMSAPPLTEDDLSENISPLEEINPQEIWNAFRACSNDLFAFILSYDYKQKRTLEQHAILFCQLAVQHPDECKISAQYAVYQTLEYPLIYAK